MRRNMLLSILALVGAAWGSPSFSAEPATPSAIVGQNPPVAKSYEARIRKIAVDGDPADWQGIPAVCVTGPEHLWFGQGMVRENWRDDADLSFRWRCCWCDDRLYFLIEVRDDRVPRPTQKSSYLCDCVEVYLDPNHRGGRHVEVLDGRSDWFEKSDPKELRGYELHFLPTDPPRVYLDHRDKYDFEKPQTDEFVRKWSGQIAARRTPDGYCIELGFSPPGARLRPGHALGLEIGVCDDDGPGRKSILMWTGTKGDFWLDMDGYGVLKLTGAGPQHANRPDRDASGTAPTPAARPKKQRRPGSPRPSRRAARQTIAVAPDSNRR